MNRLIRLDQTGQGGGNTVADKRVEFAYNAIGQFTEIARFNDLAGGSTDEVATSLFDYDSIHRLIEIAHQRDSCYRPF